MNRPSRKIDHFAGLERHLARIRSVPPLSTDEEYELAVRARRGDRAAQHDLVRHYLPLAVGLARRQRRGAVRLDDLVQEASVGLLRAAQSFDPDMGTRFSGYAVWWIRAYMTNYVHQAISSVRPRARTVAQPDVSLDMPIGDEDGASHVEHIEDDGPTPEELYGGGEHDREVRVAVGRVRRRVGSVGWDIIENRLTQDTPETLEHIGRRWGVSRERIRQIELQTREVLRRALSPIREREAA